MADFIEAFEEMIAHEGFPGYVNNPSDRGKETVAGISRKHWPGWAGWDIVDRVKKTATTKKEINAALSKHPEFRPLVVKFYRANFWTPMLNDVHSQEVANWLHDKYVNMGIRQANKLLQRAIGILDDGMFGPQTLRAVNGSDPEELVAKCRNQAQAFYTALAEKDPTQKQFLEGWLARA